MIRVAGEPNSGLGARKETIYDLFVSAATRTEAFEPSHTALFGQVGFIVGAPRSGTTWLQQLLLVHPLVTTGGESHLFCEGLPALFENWAHPEGMSHLSTWVSRPQLLRAARNFCDSVFGAQRDGTRPEARLVLEKTPNHRLQSALQAEIYPDGRYVHIIRDGRDATASQRKLWGGRTDEFADAGRAAEAWARSVRDVRVHFSHLAYLELRYEDVVTDTAGALATIFDHLRLPHDPALCAAAAAFGRAPVHTSPASPEVGIRKHAGDARAERAVARAAGDLLIDLGYADASEVDRMRRQRVGRRAPREKGRRNPAGDDVTRHVAVAVARAIEAGDAAALSRVVAPDAPGTELLSRYGLSRVTQRRVVDDTALLTLVTNEDERVVLRLTVRGGVAALVESL
jgi:hypothetical protein